MYIIDFLSALPSSCDLVDSFLSKQSECSLTVLVYRVAGTAWQGGLNTKPNLAMLETQHMLNTVKPIKGD